MIDQQSGCAQHPNGSGTAATRTTLYFAQRTARGVPIPTAHWRGFVLRTVVPQLPDGFTLLDGANYRQAAKGRRTIVTRVRILRRTHAARPADNVAIMRVREAYEKQFGKGTVRRVDEHVCLTE